MKKKFLIYLPKGTITTLKQLISNYTYSSLKLHGVIKYPNRKVINALTGKAKIVDLYSICVGNDLTMHINLKDQIQYLGFKKWKIIKAEITEDEIF